MSKNNIKKEAEEDDDVYKAINLTYIDTLFQQQAYNDQYTSKYALTIEPGLNSFIWPITNHDFLKYIYNKGVLVIHNHSQRLNELKKDLYNFDIKKLLYNSSNCIVWMKDIKSKQMQYINTPSGSIAYNCYKSGHNIYFNPSLDIQQKYIKYLCSSLGANFSANIHGGDLEIFAVYQKHITPWHFDAQENFTIQLTGYKKWTLIKAPLLDPITNYHPLSSNYQAKKNNFLINNLCHHHHHKQSSSLFYQHFINEDDQYVYLKNDIKLSKITFILRPGSTLYIPAGYYHYVECDQQSLSMNFSIDCTRYIDLFLNRFKVMLWQDSLWRKRICLSTELGLNHEQAQPFNHAKAIERIANQQFQQLLNTLPLKLSKLTSSDFLPSLQFTSNKQDVSNYLVIALTSATTTNDQDMHGINDAMIQANHVNLQLDDQSHVYIKKNPFTSFIEVKNSPSFINKQFDDNPEKENPDQDEMMIYMIHHGFGKDNNPLQYDHEITLKVMDKRIGYVLNDVIKNIEYHRMNKIDLIQLFEMHIAKLNLMDIKLLKKQFQILVNVLIFNGVWTYIKE